MHRSHVRLSFGSVSAFFVFLVILLGITAAVHAQTADDPTVDANAGADPFTIQISPQYPAPYQTISITPASTIFDIASAAITAKVNGTAFYKGSGGTDINLTVGGPGTSDNIVVTAVAGGQTYTQTLSLHPASVALVVEPVSTTHPFYAGGGLVPSEGRVRLIAIPDLRTSSGKEIDPASLTYTWTLGDQVLDSDSGIGKSVLDAQAPQQYRDADITLLVQSPDGNEIAQAETTVSPVSPVTLIYEDDPLLGPLFDTALSNSFAMSSNEDTYLGVPYYFSSTPTVDWTVNGTDSGTDPDITVRSTGSGTGTANLGFTASDPSSTETANSTLSVSFGQQSSSGLFGL